MQTARLAFTLARRELRGGLRGFWIFLACLALGVAAIAAVQSIAAGVLTALREDGQEILGGDLAVRQLYLPPAPEQLAFLDAHSTALSRTAEMRAMARALAWDAAAAAYRPTEVSSLVELKAVDDAYPLVGSVALSGGHALSAVLAPVDGVYGAALDPVLLARLGLDPGDRIAVGEAMLEIRATIEREPDRASGGSFTLGPRLMISDAALDATALEQPGSMITHVVRLTLPSGVAPAEAAAAIRAAYPEASWRIRDYTNASPQLTETIERLSLFLTLVGLTALLVGGVGVGNAVKSYLDARLATIATLKCLGASSALILATYLVQVMVLGAAGTAIGLLIGTVAPLLLGGVLADLLPIDARVGLYPGALALAAGFGLLIALTFSVVPLARARAVAAGALFRDLVAPAKASFGPTLWVTLGLAVAGLVALAVLTTEERTFAAVFVAGAVAALGVFRGAAWLAVWGAGRLARPRHPGARLAIANLHRPGASTPTVMLSLGLGLTVLVAIALIEGNMSRQVQDEIPQDAPAFFFVDIQPDQIAPFRAAVLGIDGTSDLEEVPSLRGRIVAVNGVAAGDALVDPDQGWILNGDRGVTYRTRPRAGDTVIAGAWWAEDYAGPPLLSLYEDIAAAFGIGVGDRMTVNVLGRDIEAEVANIRDIDWSTVSINFTLVFSPRPLSAAPHSFLATVDVDGDTAEGAVQRAVTTAFPNVTAVRVADALDTITAVLGQIATAVRSTAGVTLVAGTLVLAGAIAAGHRRRVYDAVVLKVLGATRGDVMRAFAVEYGLLGLLTAAIAALVGTLTAWAVLTYVMRIEWVFLPMAVLTTTVLATGITLALGFAGTWRALGQKAAPLLRNE